MRRVTREWDALRSFLPEGWEEAARETGAAEEEKCLLIIRRWKKKSIL